MNARFCILSHVIKCPSDFSSRTCLPRSKMYLCDTSKAAVNLPAVVLRRLPANVNERTCIKLFMLHNVAKTTLKS